mgnify:CR=1 FL=1
MLNEVLFSDRIMTGLAMIVEVLYNICKGYGCNGNVEIELCWIVMILGSFGKDLFGFFSAGVEVGSIFIVFAMLCVLILLISH